MCMTSMFHHCVHADEEVLAVIRQQLQQREQRQWAIFDDTVTYENAQFERQYGDVIKANEEKVRRAEEAADAAIKRKREEVYM